MVLPPMGSGATAGATAAGAASTAAPAQRLGQQTTNEQTGATETRTFGQAQIGDWATALKMAQGDPAIAAQLLRMAMGGKSRGLGFMSDTRDTLYGQALQAALSLANTSGFGDTTNIMDDFLTNGVQGNDLLGYTSGLASKIGGMDFGGMSSPDIEKFLRTQQYMKGLSGGSLGNSANNGYLENLLWEAMQRELGGGYADETNFADLLKNSRYAQAMGAIQPATATP
jgi:hypothetical protein